MRDGFVRQLFLPAILFAGLLTSQARACCCPGVSVTALEGMKDRPVVEGEYYHRHFGVRDISALEKGDISIQVSDVGGAYPRLKIKMPNRYKGNNIRVVLNSIFHYVERKQGQPFTKLSSFTVVLYRIEERGGVQTIKVLDKKGTGVKTIALAADHFILTDFRPVKGESFRVSVVVKERGLGGKIVAAHSVSASLKHRCGLNTYVMTKKRAVALRKKQKTSSDGLGSLIYKDHTPLRFGD